MFSTSNMVFGGAFVVLVASVSSDAVQGVLYDDETPLVQTLSVSPESAKVRAGETFTADYEYFRRPGCIGHVEYRLEGTPNNWKHPVSIPIARFDAGWSDGEGEQTVRVTIPADFWPGTYKYVFLTTADACHSKGGYKAASRPIQTRSLPVTVVVTKD